MQVSRRVDYGIRAMVDIASLPANSIASTRDVAKRQEIPQIFLTKIVTRLMRAGLVGTQRGAAGGIYLARPAEEINMLDIVEAVDGCVALNHCTQLPSKCKRDAYCPSRPVWQRVQEDMLRTLKEARLSDLTKRDQDVLPLAHPRTAGCDSAAGSRGHSQQRTCREARSRGI